MENLFILSGRHSHEESRPIIDEALEKQTSFAYTMFMKFEKECRSFEAAYLMNSEEFSDRFESGGLGDELQWFDWYAALRGKIFWEKKYKILKDIMWKA